MVSYLGAGKFVLPSMKTAGKIWHYNEKNIIKILFPVSEVIAAGKCL